MKKKHPLSGVMLLLIFTSLGTVRAQHLKNVRPITPAGDFFAPVLSPDGDKVLCTDSHNDALYLIELGAAPRNKGKMKKIKKGKGIGYGASWSADGRHILFQEQVGEFNSQREVRQISIETLREETSPIAPASPTFLSGRAPKNDLILYINIKTLKLEAKKGPAGKPWVVTEEPGSYYQPLPAPDGRTVLVHEGPYMYLYSLEGSFQRKNLGKGLATSWLPDSEHFLSFQDGSADGHHLSTSELYMKNLRTSTTVQLTHTDDLIETWPSASPDGKKIVFSDEKSGKIYIADLIL